MASFSLSACAPAFNEAGNIERVVRGFDESLRVGGVEYEIVIVDDGSRDGTADLLASLRGEIPALRVVTHSKNEGYGKSLRDAFAAARMDYVFYTDGDGQFDLGEMLAFLPLLDGRNAVVGYRLGRAEGALRKFLSWGYNALVRLLFGLRVRDVDCSFKFLPRRELQSLELYSDKFFIDTELMVKLRRLGVPLLERGVRHLPREHGRSTVSAGHIFTTLKEIVGLIRERGTKKTGPRGGPRRSEQVD
ncbi:MAG: glycosyltransferase family 2 protein [Candidatus Coatesbacteria bacterium]|nr:MAG: glycosyltransferase family 2 protein [Candidatus Coatesbacteria bacterium]